MGPVLQLIFEILMMSAVVYGVYKLWQKADLKDKDFQALFRNADFIGNHFLEEFTADVTANWYIVNENVIVAPQPPTVVDGPRIKWRGQTGTIPAMP